MMYFAKLKDFRTILMSDKFVSRMMFDLDTKEEIVKKGTEMLQFLRDYSGHWVKVEEENGWQWSKETGKSLLIYEDWFAETVRV
jgi:hypothetical protein